MRKVTATPFKEVCQHIERVNGRTITVQHLRQLLTLVPDFYDHSWETKGREVNLIIGLGHSGTQSRDER